MLALVTVLAAAGFHASPAAAARNPFTCAGYPEARVFIEAQSWWRTTPGENGTDHGHGHFGACIPLGKKVSGIVHIDWVAKLHENPGFVKQVWSELSVPGNGALGGKSLFYDGTGAKGYSCPLTANCSFVIPTNYDTRISPYDGRQELQTRMLIREPDGNAMRPSVRFPLYLANGKRVNSNPKAKLNTYGWYTGALYAWVDLWSGVPRAPISGVWRIGDVSFRAASADNSVTSWFVSVDPNFHAIPEPFPGVVYYDRATACVPKTKGCSGPRHTALRIDTTRLANGRHKLFLRTDAQDGRGSTNSGAMVVRFTVRN